MRGNFFIKYKQFVIIYKRPDISRIYNILLLCYRILQECLKAIGLFFILFALAN